MLLSRLCHSQRRRQEHLIVGQQSSRCVGTWEVQQGKRRGWSGVRSCVVKAAGMNPIRWKNLVLVVVVVAPHRKWTMCVRIVWLFNRKARKITLGMQNCAESANWRGSTFGMRGLLQ